MRPHTPQDLVAAARDAGVRDERVLRAVAAVPRAAYVPAQATGEASLDAPVPIPAGQVTSQPSLIARMVEALALTGGERVLEVGTGHGYQAAVLAQLAGEVFTLELEPVLARAARENLARQGVANVTVVAADGAAGLPEHAPYDAIVVAAATPDVPAALVDQLLPGGRLVAPLSAGAGEEVVAFERRAEGLERHGVVTPASFVPLRDRATSQDDGTV